MSFHSICMWDTLERSSEGVEHSLDISMPLPMIYDRLLYILENIDGRAHTTRSYLCTHENRLSIKLKPIQTF